MSSGRSRVAGPGESFVIDVRHVSHLCMLELDDEEIADMEKELASILEHARELLTVDTSGVEPSFGSSDGARLRLSPDAVLEDIPAGELLRGAPSVAQGFVMVPRVRSGV